MSIFKDISHLLHSNDCVILPDFGAFILKSKSAYIENNEYIDIISSLLFSILRYLLVK